MCDTNVVSVHQVAKCPVQVVGNRAKRVSTLAKAGEIGQALQAARAHESVAFNDKIFDSIQQMYPVNQESQDYGINIGVSG